VLQFQLAHGFVDGDARDAAEALLGEAAAAGERHPGNLNSTNPLDVADTTATVVTYPAAGFAVVLHDADLQFADRTPGTLAALSALKAAMRDAVCAECGRPVAPRSTVVLVSSLETLPPELDSLPALQSIAVGATRYEERRAVLEQLALGFAGASELPGDALDAALEELARLTAGQPLTRLEQLRRVSVEREIAITDGRALIAAASQVERTPAPAAGRARETIAARTIGQDHVVNPVAELIDARAWPHAMYDPAGTSARPLRLALLGMPGSGKTDLARGIARAAFGSAEQIVVIPGNALHLGHGTASVTGAPSGYVGYGDGQSIVEQLARRGPCVILFDEFDRAHRHVLEVFLTALEEGRLPAGRGAGTVIGECILVLTSNVGSEEVAARVGGGELPDRATVAAIHRRALERKLLAPLAEGGLELAALWSRLRNHVYVFDLLRAESVPELIGWFGSWVVANARHDWKLNLQYDVQSLTEAVRARLGAPGTWDARDVRDHVERLLHDPVRAALAAGEVSAGQRVLVSHTDGRAELHVTTDEDLAA